MTFKVLREVLPSLRKFPVGVCRGMGAYRDLGAEIGIHCRFILGLVLFH